MGRTRAIRTSDKENKMIEEFLINNPIFDFSTLAKVAILRFIENPEINLKAVKRERSREKRVTNASIN